MFCGLTKLCLISPSRVAKKGITSACFERNADESYGKNTSLTSKARMSGPNVKTETLATSVVTLAIRSLTPAIACSRSSLVAYDLAQERRKQAAA